MSLFLLAVISFLCYRETAGDSGLPEDSNTVVGKPRLGEQNCDLLWSTRKVSLLSRPGSDQLLFIFSDFICFGESCHEYLVFAVVKITMEETEQSWVRKKERKKGEKW